MHTYLVGGAVRDKLLGKPVRERDWVVVGSTATDMRRLGFTQGRPRLSGIPASQDQGAIRASTHRTNERTAPATQTSIATQRPM